MHSISSDPHWAAAQQAVMTRWSASARVVAPLEFKYLVGRTIPYGDAHRQDLAAIDLVLVHKGRMEELGRGWLERVLEKFEPVFANEVFVVLAKESVSPTCYESDHFKAFFEMLRSLPEVEGSEGEASAPRACVYLGNNRALTETIYGHKIYLDTRELDLTPHLLFDGVYEPSVTEVLRRWLAPGMAVIDVGANVGYYALLAADAIGPSGRLYAVEPEEEVAEMLRTNIEINGYGDRVSIVNKAAFDHSGKVTVRCHRKRRREAHTWWEESRQGATRTSTPRLSSVAAVPLDKVVPIGSLVDVLKIDAGEHTLNVLGGAGRILSENRSITVILALDLQLSTSPEWSADGYSRLFQQLREWEFLVYRVAAHGSLVQYSGESMEEVPVFRTPGKATFLCMR